MLITLKTNPSALSTPQLTLRPQSPLLPLPSKTHNGEIQRPHPQSCRRPAETWEAKSAQKGSAPFTRPSSSTSPHALTYPLPGKTGKAAVQAQRTTRLAARNPNRLERQIADLQALPSPSARDKKALEDAERELARVRRAKEKLGGGDHHLHGQSHRDQPSREGGAGGGGRLLGKRTTREWDGADSRKGIGRAGAGAGQDEADAGSTSGEETDASVRAIPMPRDTPPPIPHPSRNRNRPHPHPHHAPNVQNATTSNLTNANLEPVSSARGLDTQPLSQPGPGSSAASATAAAASPPPPPKTVYEAKPIVRDLRKEAVNKFVPEAVRRRKIVDPVPTGAIPGMTAASAAAAAAAQAGPATAAKTEPETRNIQIVSSSLHQQPITPGGLASPILQSPPPSSTQEYQHQHQQEQKHEEEAEEELIASAPSRTTQEIPSSSTETQQTQPKATKKLPLTLLYGDDPTTTDDENASSSEEEQTQTQTKTPNPNPNPNHDSNRDSNADIDKVLEEEEKRFREETWKWRSISICVYIYCTEYWILNTEIYLSKE